MINEMIEHAELLINSGENGKALALYDQVIAEAAPDSFLYRQRGKLRRMNNNFDGAIMDFSAAIKCSPDDADLYWERGASRTHQLSGASGIDEPTRSSLLKESLTDYQASVERDPANANAWLDIVETDLLLHDWDAAISHYAQCRPHICSEQYRVVRAWLGCLALCMAGDGIAEEDGAALYDDTIRLDRTDWCVAEIDGLLDELESVQDMSHTLACAMNVHRSFLEHFDDHPIRAV